MIVEEFAMRELSLRLLVACLKVDIINEML